MTEPAPSDPLVARLLEPWQGPCGGLPPFDHATPAAIGRACEIAIDWKRAAVEAIAADPAPPTFANTIAALEDADRELKRVECLRDVFARTMNRGDMRDVERRLAPLSAALQDEIVGNRELWRRLDEVWEARAGLAPVDRRLTEVVHEHFLRRGAALDPQAGERLAKINRRIAELEVSFSQSTLADEESRVVRIDDAGGLDGLDDGLREALRSAARAAGHDDGWAVPNRRSEVVAFLTSSVRRDLRERVWRMWTERGRHDDPHDNRPVVAEILRLRGEKARLLGYPSYAHYATADRMCGDPETAMTLVKRTWDAVIRPAIDRLDEIRELAREDGLAGELAPWDRRFYLERLRRRRLHLDADAVRAHLPLDRLLEAAFWTAGELYGLAFEPDAGAPRVHDDVVVFSVRRDGAPAGMLWLDLFARPGKVSGGWMALYRTAESYRQPVPPLASVNLNLTPPRPGRPPLLSFGDARVLFHELGHALHALLCEPHYPSLGMLALNPDVLELPSILNERWLFDRQLLRRFAHHYRTGEPMPEAMIETLVAARHDDPEEGETATLGYLATAVVDLELHLAADGRTVNPERVERQALAALGLPPAAEPLHRAAHLRHAFAGLYEDRYASGYYGYLWAEMLAADVAEAFEASPGGLHDRHTAERYRRAILSAGHRVPAGEAFESFRGRAPEPAALTRRLGLPDHDASPPRG